MHIKNFYIRIIACLSIFILLSFSQGFAQDQSQWGPWINFSCWKGLYFHVSRGNYNSLARKYPWNVQFRSTYSQPVSFTYNIMDPSDVAAYKSGNWQPKGLGEEGRITLAAGEDQSRDPKDGFLQPGVYDVLEPAGNEAYVAALQVCFGKDDGNYATDDCGHNSGAGSGNKAGSVPTGKWELPYGNDVATPETGPFKLETQQDGVSIYVAWVYMGGNSLAIDVKVTNENSFPVIVTWAGPKWYNNGSYIDPMANPGILPEESGYSDIFNPGESKDATGHTINDHGTEVYKFRRNWLYFHTPKGVWQRGQLSMRLTDLEVLNSNGSPLNGNNPQAQNTQTTSVRPQTQTASLLQQAQTTRTTVAPVTSAVRPATGNTSNRQQQVYQQQANNYQAAINNSSTPIQQALNTNLARMNAQAAGNTAQVRQLQQMQQIQQQNTVNAVVGVVGQLVDLLAKPKSTQSSDEEGKTEELASSNTISSEAKLRATYDKAHRKDYQNNLYALGKYSQTMRIDLTPELVKRPDNRSQRETMDFLAGTIWQYSKTKNFRFRVLVDNIIDEIAFTDSVFYYKCHDGLENAPSTHHTKIFQIDLNKTRVSHFEISPGDEVSHDDLYLTVKTSNPKESLEFHLTADAVAGDIPMQLISAFTHLIVLCHGPVPLQ